MYQNPLRTIPVIYLSIDRSICQSIHLRSICPHTPLYFPFSLFDFAGEELVANSVCRQVLLTLERECARLSFHGRLPPEPSHIFRRLLSSTTAPWSLESLGKFVIKLRWFFVILFVMLIALSSWVGSGIQPSTEPPSFFPDDSNLNLLHRLKRDYLPDSNFKRAAEAENSLPHTSSNGRVVALLTIAPPYSTLGLRNITELIAEHTLFPTDSFKVVGPSPSECKVQLYGLPQVVPRTMFSIIHQLDSDSLWTSKLLSSRSAAISLTVRPSTGDALTLNEVFRSGKTYYTVTVNPKSHTASFDATLQIPRLATLAWSDGQTDATVSKVLRVDESIGVTVTAEDGLSTTAYLILAVKVGLKDIHIDGTTVEPNFDPRVKTYRAHVPFDEDVVSINPVANYDGLQIEQVPPNPVSLPVGATSIQLVAGDTKYTLIVNRNAADSAANIQSIGFSSPLIRLHPPFDPDSSRSSYSAYFVNYLTGTVNLSIVVAENATLTQSPPNPVPLPSKGGITHVTLHVEHPSSSQERQYRVDVIMYTGLYSLAVSAGKLSPSFDPRVFEYTVSVTDLITSLKVSAVPMNSDDVVSFEPPSAAGMFELGQLDNSVSIFCGNFTYQLQIIRDVHDEDEPVADEDPPPTVDHVVVDVSKIIVDYSSHTRWTAELFVDISSDGGVSWIPACSGSMRQCTILELEANKHYVVRVGKGSVWTYEEVATLPCYATSAPRNMAMNYDTMKLTWSAVEEAKGYKVMRWDESELDWISIKNTVYNYMKVREDRLCGSPLGRSVSLRVYPYTTCSRFLDIDIALVSDPMTMEIPPLLETHKISKLQPGLLHPFNVTMEWAPPSCFDGYDREDIEYEVTFGCEDKSETKVVQETRELYVDKLTPGSSCWCSVRSKYVSNDSAQDVQWSESEVEDFDVPPVAPLPPTGVTVDTCQNSADCLLVTWEATADTGGEPVVYEVAWSEGLEWEYKTGNEELQRQLLHLTDGMRYKAKVRAKNSAGLSDWSAESPVSPLVVLRPKSPSDIVIETGETCSELTIRWSVSGRVSSGIGFDVTLDLPSFEGLSTTGNTFVDIKEEDIECSTSLSAQVRTTSSSGDETLASPWVTTTFTTSSIEPDPPIITAYTLGPDGQLELNWKAPSYHGVDLIERFEVHCTLLEEDSCDTPSMQSEPLISSVIPSSSESRETVELGDESEWCVRFSACNSQTCGKSAFFATSFNESAPNPPSGVTAKCEDTVILVRWDRVAEAIGVVEISDVSVPSSPQEVLPWTNAAASTVGGSSTSQFEWDVLYDGGVYEIGVKLRKAVNGKESEVVTVATSCLSSVPGPIFQLEGQPWSGDLRLVWQPPGDDSTIRWYKITVDGDVDHYESYVLPVDLGVDDKTGSLSTVVPLGAPGSLVIAEVFACSLAGCGECLGPVSVVIDGLEPQPPSSVTIEASGKNKVVVSWTWLPMVASIDSSKVKIGYPGNWEQIEKPNHDSSALSDSAPVSNLVPDKTYQIKVKLCNNRNGCSQYSEAIDYHTPRLRKPGILNIVGLDVTTTTIELSWQVPWLAPEADSFIVLWKRTGTEDEWSANEVNSDTHHDVITELSPATSYSVKVRGRNGDGLGPSTYVTTETWTNEPQCTLSADAYGDVAVVTCHVVSYGQLPIRTIEFEFDRSVGSVINEVTSGPQEGQLVVEGLAKGSNPSFSCTCTNEVSTPPLAAIPILTSGITQASLISTVNANVTMPATLSAAPEILSFDCLQDGLVEWSPLTSLDIDSYMLMLTTEGQPTIFTNYSSVDVCANGGSCRVGGFDLLSRSDYTARVAGIPPVGHNETMQEMTAWSAPLSSTTGHTVPSPPTVLHIGEGRQMCNHTQTSLTLAWTLPEDGGTDVKDFEVSITSGDFKDSIMTSNTSVSLRLPPGVQYSIKVRAKNELGWSEWSRSTVCDTETFALSCKKTGSYWLEIGYAKLKDVASPMEIIADGGGAESFVYGLDGVLSRSSVTIFSNERHTVNPGVDYNLQLRPSGHSFHYSTSEGVLCPTKTSPSPDPPTNIQCSVEERSVLLRWGLPEYRGSRSDTTQSPNLDVIRFEATPTSGGVSYTHEIPATDSKTNFDALPPGIFYNISISVNNTDGGRSAYAYCDSLIVTMGTVPKKFVRPWTRVTFDIPRVTLSWRDVDFTLHENMGGVVTAFVIDSEPDLFGKKWKNGTAVIERVGRESDSLVVVGQAKIGTLYSIWISMKNEFGDGEPSDPIHVMSMPCGTYVVDYTSLPAVPELRCESHHCGKSDLNFFTQDGRSELEACSCENDRWGMNCGVKLAAPVIQRVTGTAVTISLGQDDNDDVRSIRLLHQVDSLTPSEVWSTLAESSLGNDSYAIEWPTDDNFHKFAVSVIATGVNSEYWSPVTEQVVTHVKVPKCTEQKGKNDCSGHGDCVLVGDQPTCVCDKGYSTADSCHDVEPPTTPSSPAITGVRRSGFDFGVFVGNLSQQAIQITHLEILVSEQDDPKHENSFRFSVNTQTGTVISNRVRTKLEPGVVYRVSTRTFNGRESEPSEPSTIVGPTCSELCVDSECTLMQRGCAVRGSSECVMDGLSSCKCPHGARGRCDMLCPILDRDAVATRNKTEGATESDYDYDSACGGRGMCTVVKGRPLCQCNDGFWGPACENRCDCPSGRSCDGATGQCDCLPPFTGHDCTVRCPGVVTCFDETRVCSGHGICKFETATNTSYCACHRYADGPDCSHSRNPYHPSQYLPLQIIWGVKDFTAKAFDAQHPVEPVWDEEFVLDERAQVQLNEVCEEIEAGLDEWRQESGDDLVLLQLHDDVCQPPNPVIRCAMASFRSSLIEEECGGIEDDFCIDTVFPVQSQSFEEKFNSWILGAGGGILSDILYDDAVNSHPRVQYLRVALRTGLYNPDSRSGQSLQLLYDDWEAFISSKNAQSPKSFQAYQTSSHWPRMLLEVKFLEGTIRSLVVSIGCAFIAMILFTRSILISMTSIVTIVGITASAMAFFTWSGMTLGAVEAISITVLVGLSVDYCLHIGHAYAGSTQLQSSTRTVVAIKEIGGPIISAAFTTVGSLGVLLFCRITVFVTFGKVISVTCVISVLYAIFMNGSLLGILGPKARLKGTPAHSTVHEDVQMEILSASPQPAKDAESENATLLAEL